MSLRFVTDASTTEAFDAWSRTFAYADTQVLAESPLDFVAARYDEDTAFNLLQGAYESTDIYSETLSKWSEVAVVAMTCLLASSLVLGVEGYWARHHMDLIRDAGNELYESIFDEPNTFGSPAARMQERVGLASGSSNRFERLLAGVAASVKGDELTSLWYSRS